MSSENGQVSICLDTVIFLFYLVHPYALKTKTTNCKHSRQKSYGLQISQ